MRQYQTICAQPIVLLWLAMAPVLALGDEILDDLPDVETDVDTRPSVDTQPYRARIRSVEREHGALDYRLSEHFLALGLAYRANDEPELAISALQQALHVNRINKGLHHLLHVPIVDLLIEAYAKQRDWAAVEQQHRFRYWVHRRELAESSDEFIDAAMLFAGWQTRSYNLETGVASFRKLRDAQDALNAAYAAVAAHNTLSDPRLIPILNSQAQANLNIAIYMSNTDEDPATGGRTTGDDFGDIIERRNIILESFAQGKAALEEATNVAEQRGVAIEHGLALANLADWELIFDRPQSSAENYRRAYKVATNAGLSGAELEREFGRPRQMGTFTVQPRAPLETSEDRPDSAYVVASFLVTTTGRVRKVDLIESQPAEDNIIRRRARENLRAARFRPRIDAEGPVEATGTITYVFPETSI